ncbi:PREDICTED: uncharacterized protein LOC104612373 [Nelumbo nucifera]|uniref:Uncharacterized protein LOC104591015 n=2 Tax=Nelumbo nucifera TaxID=4432 RepID=A0A1U7ZAE5_NELNU|nr:PREDICTED: uncharacterized protein LOC104591015 [Nelumbo nucifera]XP_010278068.1 PREDICTED: uncharacterized protein LOC104612373 [Nelumbo nucifera]DAD27539.1 TPA_asm: hypothetical protein HUJ06_029007 [Nelumbo nucifera]DAD27540.1 TPA_asm: hypothetical protein HUJ06_029008 [Nelumbo nucifera]
MAKLTRQPASRIRFSELAGETAAECMAVCCCFPCGVVDMLVLAVYRVPAGLCRKAMKKRSQQRKKGSPLSQQQVFPYGCDEAEFEIHIVSQMELDEIAKTKEVIELDKEMWDRFYETGFWRSLSRLERE